MIELGPNRYGKAAIHIVRVARDPAGHRVRDITVGVALEGNFGAVHTGDDNSLLIATDTMKNTAFAIARDGLDGSIEAYGGTLAAHFLGFDQVERATVDMREHAWHPIDVRGAPARDAFVRDEGIRVATVSATANGTTVEAGVEDLVVMKTTRSAFKGFPRDRYTTLPDTDDRLLATKLSATWRYRGPVADGDRTFDAVRTTLLEVFADHDSASVQASIWIIGREILRCHDDVDEIRMVMPNLHHFLIDLAPFGLTNDGQIYISTTEPHGLIEATVRREQEA